MLSVDYSPGAINTGYKRKVGNIHKILWKTPDPEQLTLFDLAQYDVFGYGGPRNRYEPPYHF